VVRVRDSKEAEMELGIHIPGFDEFTAEKAGYADLTLGMASMDNTIHAVFTQQ
jgi:hypothetical protein